MANINKLEILSGNYVSSDNKVYNLVDILKDKLNYTQEAKFSLSNTNIFNNLSGNIIGSDSKIYNLVDILNDGSTPIPPTPTYTFTINPTPEDATVKINDVERTSIIVEENTPITWSVEKEGYTSQSGNLILTENKTLDIILQEIPEGFIQSADYTQDGVTIKLNNTDLSSLESKAFALAWQNGFNNDFTLGDKTFSDYIYSSRYMGNKSILVIFDTPQVINKLYLSAYCGLKTSVTKNISFTKPSGEGFTKSITFDKETFPGAIDVGGEEIKYFSFNINYTTAASYIFLAAIRINSSE